MIGHNAVRTILERHLPTATLLHGPTSVGKWTLAVHLADYHQVTTWDRWPVEWGFNIDTVRLITAFAARPPHGRFKLILASLDGCHRKTLNALLKTLEEPPPAVKFLFVSSGTTLPTVASRCTVHPLGLLTEAELVNVYRDQGFPTAKARRAAAYARGQVSRGYELDQAESHHQQIVDVIRALTTGDRDLFTKTFRNWDGRSTEMLDTFFTECLTQRWRIFTDTEAAGLHQDRKRLWNMVTAVTRLRNARPRLGVRAALEPFL